MTRWEKFFEEKIREIAREKHILDIGGGFKQQKELGKYKELFKNCDYKVLDKNKDFKPDFVGDVQDLSFINDGSVDAVICKAVLEHVENPIKATEEIYRVLRPGGKCLVYVPFLYSYHAHLGVYKDYYRYTLDGLKLLLRKFSAFEYVAVRGRFETIIYLLPIKFIRKFLSPVGRVLDIFFKTEKQSSGYLVFLIK